MRKRRIYYNKSICVIKRHITSVSKSTKRMGVHNSQGKTLQKKLSNQQNKSNKNIKKESIQTVTRRTYALIFSLFGPLLRVAPTKITRQNSFISHILPRFLPSFCSLDLTYPKRPIRKSRNAWFRFQRGKVSQLSSRVFLYSQLQLDLMFMKLATPNISAREIINSSKFCSRH